MPVTEQTPVNSYSGNGVTTVFAYSFKILASDDIEVSISGVVQTSGYSVSGVGSDGGGNVTFTVAPADGTGNVVLRRQMAYDRDIDYQENGDLTAATLDEDIDRAIMMMQQIKAEFLRALKLPIGTTTDQEITGTAAARANRYIAFDSSGNLTLAATVDPGALVVSAFVETLLDDLDAATARSTLGAVGTDGTVANVTGAAISAFALTADITPAQITANTNDYAPTGLATASTLRLSTDALRDLTGLTGGSDGRLMIVHNVGSNALVLKNESASSTAANRFALGGADVTLAASQSVTLQYDSTSSRWRMAHTAGGAVASTAEAQALTDNTKMVTPLRLKEALQGSNQSLGASGYQKLPGGLIIQWMKQSAASGSTAITFPMAFPTACFVVTGTLGTSATYDWPFQVVEGTITASGCTIYRNAVQPAYIIALGY